MIYYDEMARYHAKRAQYRAMSIEERKTADGRILRQEIELIGEELKPMDREAAVNTSGGRNK